jgi:site-specific DNA-methyltransferase (adenine-specific)
MKSGNVENLPIIVPSISIQNQITDLADDILNLKIMNSIENTIELEKQIDDLVYKLYNLTPEEIAIVEENTKK